MRKESPEELLNLVDRFEQHLAVLKRLGEDTDSWDSLLICQLSVRLDPRTLKEWEGYCARLDCDNVANVLGGASSEDAEEEDMPTYVAMVNFLQNYARVLQSIGPVPGPTRDRDTKAKSSKFSAHVSSTSAPSGSDSSKKCEKCNQLHFLYHCPEFQKLPEQQRFEFVKSKKLCANCLRSTDHFAKSCPAKQCNRCAKKHHTLLHGAQFVQPPPPGSQSSSSASLVAQPVDSKPAPPTPSPVVNVPAQSLQHQSQPQRLYPVVGSHPQQCSTVPTVPANRHYAMMACDKENEPTAVILPTALVEIEDARGRKLTARCLLDSGSQSHFITKALCDRLQLPRIRATAPVLVCGIGQTTTKVTDSVTAKVSSRVSPYVVEPQLLVLPSLAIKLPGAMINTREWQIPATVRLADPTFHVSNDVDVILGAQFFFDTLRYGRIQLGENMPVLQNTALGWVVAGPCTIRDHDHADPRSCLMSSTARVEELLRKFWDLETVHDTRGWSATDKICEEHFLANTTRTSDGRYIVKLPKREDLVHQLDDNMYQATRRFYSLERSLMSDPQKRKMYQDFVSQYINMGHMREVTEEELNIKPQFVLPHHGVVKLDSATTKLRTVFDASCRSRSGLALNDVLIPGPTIQDTLVEIVLRFRLHRFVVSADIEKMFLSTPAINRCNVFCGVIILIFKSRCIS